jgi:hypothetical protein
MSCDVRLPQEAEEDLRRLGDPVLHSHVLDQLEHLSRAPTTLSRRASFPHRPFQQYQFWSPDHTIHFTVLFQYSQDEQAIVILSVGVVRY